MLNVVSNAALISSFASKSWEIFEELPIHIVLAVCDQAAGEVCPAYLNDVFKAHWGSSDPAGTTGANDDIKAAFETTFNILEGRVHQILAMPEGQLSDQEFVDELNRIGSLSNDRV